MLRGPASLVVADRVFTADPDHPWAEAIVIADGRVVFAGSRGAAAEFVGKAAEVIDVPGGFVIPGFVDAHAHVLEMGESLTRAQLRDAHDLAAIRERLVAWTTANPRAQRVLGLGWMFSSVPDGRPHTSHLDDLFADLPVYLDASDLHSTWVNSAALDELGITDDTPDPVGGRIVRDATGRATGLLLETASFTLVPPVIGRVDDSTRDQHLATAIRAYNASGVTTAVDMALESDSFATMKRARSGARMTLKVAAHWMIHRSDDPSDELAQVHHAAERFHETRADDFLRVVGIKVMVDGTIDGCTAALRRPYADGSSVEPIWDDASLRRVVMEADRLGMQIALHAIGDAAVHSALDSLEEAIAAHGTRDHRHRIEHLEYVDQQDMPRLARLGVTASMQPVHCDPAGLSTWCAVLGDERAEQGFAWSDLVDQRATLAFGTDTPTASHLPLRNMYIAATRRSPENPALAAYTPHQAVTLTDAITFATRQAAWASHLDRQVGSIRPGLAADMVILDRDPFAVGPEGVLDASVVATMVNGRVVAGGPGRSPG